jgi:hypothetical protein
LARKYGKDYRSLGISETTLAGKRAAVWEFEIDSGNGTTRKIDVAVHDRGTGFAVLGSAPAGNFESMRPRLEAAINSFQLKSERGDGPATSTRRKSELAIGSPGEKVESVPPVSELPPPGVTPRRRDKLAAERRSGPDRPSGERKKPADGY